MDMDIGHCRVHDHRGVHFEDPTVGKELSRLREQRGTALQCQTCSGGLPGKGRVGLHAPRYASTCPTRTRPPLRHSGSQVLAPGGSSNMTVEPMLNRPISAPLERCSGAWVDCSGKSNR